MYNILETLIKLRDDLKTWVTKNLVALDAKIESKTIPIDSELDTDSTNPVQNKTIAKEIADLNNLVGETPVADQIATAIANQPEVELPNITDDESGEFNIADPNGNVIFKVDSNGAHTTDVEVDGTSIKSKIPEWDAKSDFSGDYNDLDNKPNITDDESSEYVIADDSGNIIFKVDAEGAHTTDVTVDGKSVSTHINTVNSHISDTNIHVTEAEREAWNARSDFSGDFNDLTNAPNITEDESGELVYADEDGNIIARINADGFKTTKVSANDVEINGKSVTTIMDERVAAMVDSAPEALNTLNELAGALGDDPNFATTIAQQIGEKANQSDLTSHTGNKSNPHGVTADQVGAVPFTRKVNGKELSEDIILDDVAISQIKEQFAIGDTADEISSVTEWTQATVPSGFNARQRACCYGNGYYVIAGTSGQMVYSTDGVTWILVTAFTSDVITGLAYGNGRFVAVDSAGKIFSAALPIDTWEQVYTNLVIIESVRYLNNRFVAVGENGFFVTSVDAINWNQQTVPTTNTLIDSAYGNGFYVAVGASGTIIRSINLIDWFDYSLADFGDIRTAMFTGKGFVVGGKSGNIAHSADGATWSMATNNTTSTVNWIRAFAYAEKRIYAVMYISTGAGEIWVSKDGGATWAVDKSVAGRLWCIIHGNGRFITSGDNGAIYVLDLGVEWTDEEPSEGASIWHRYIATLSNGDSVISESYKTTIASYTETDPTVPAWAKASTKPSYTASEVGARPNTWTPSAEDIGAAKLQSPNNMLHNGNEFTFIPAGHTGELYINYRTASGATDGNISNYHFCNGAGGETTIMANYFKGKFQGADARPIYNNAEVAMLSDVPTSLPASDVYNWAKQPSKPTYTASEIGAAPAYSYGTSDLTAGSSSLETGKLYFVYE